MSSLPQFISPSIFQSEVTISKPRIDLERAAQLIQNDATKTFGWPKDLPVETITQNLRCVYLAHWIVTGQGSGQWSALVGEHKRSASGVATGSVQGRVVENYAKLYKNEEEFHLLGKRDYTAEESPLDNSTANSIQVIKPESFTLEGGRKAAEDAIESAIWLDGYEVAEKTTSDRSVKNFRLGYLSFRNVKFRTWLYPVYMGTYEYKNKERVVKMDGITGHTTIDKSASWFVQASDWGFILLPFGAFGAMIYGLFAGETALCIGSFIFLLILLAISQISLKIQEYTKSGRRE